MQNLRSKNWLLLVTGILRRW